MDCAVCGLKLVLAPHLARSFHHLFPVPPFVELPDDVNLKDLYKDLGSPENVTSNSALPPVVSSSSTELVKPSPTTDDNIEGTLIIDSTYCDRCCYGCMKIIPSQKQNENEKGAQQQQQEQQQTPQLTLPPASFSQPSKQLQTSDSKTATPTNNSNANNNNKRVSVQEPSLRFQCPDCLNIFCADCDAYLHETLHNCPGCLCKG